MAESELKTVKYGSGAVIFREGDPGTCLYEVLRGRVGIYASLGTPEEKLLTENGEGDTFGEMAMVEAQPRSASAVALEEGTELRICTWETLGSFFRERPAKVVVMMQQMSRRIRQLTEDYLGACQAVTHLTEQLEQQQKEREQEKAQAEKNLVDQKLRRYLDAYRSWGVEEQAVETDLAQSGEKKEAWSEKAI
ncbi:MAG: Crp/Fnr family transcriptional regulator [Oscillospiraceae bacterium]|nr:Crp/Fnr family transcriptional regulator [Oscillospiraceae bacterium]